MRRTAHSIARTGPARLAGTHLVAANEPRACRNCTGICHKGRHCPTSAEGARSTMRLLVRVFGPYLLAVAAALLLAAAPAVLGAEAITAAEVPMKASLTHAIDRLATWAAHVSPAQWVLLGLIVFLLAMLIAAYFQDFWLALERSFEGHGVGKDDMAQIHERTWPEYWN